MTTAKSQPTAAEKSSNQAPEPVPNPVLCREGRGVRHFACIHYDACLDKAAKGMWTGFTCIECAFYPARKQD